MKKYIIICFFCFLSSCASFSPFVDARREAGKIGTIGESSEDVVVICYGAYGTSQEEIINLAINECAKTSRKPKFLKQESFSCTLFEPTKVYYKCE